MSTTNIIGIVIVVVLVAAFAVVTLLIARQRKALRDRFGGEYELVVSEKGGRTAGEAELRRRQRRHDDLPLRDLTEDERAQFRDGWTAVQGQFIDDPALAVHAADRLVSRLVAARGYPVVDYADRLAHLSVDHAAVLSQYRQAHDISVRNDAGEATTEELRQALVHYRELVAELLGERPVVDTAPIVETAPVEAAPVAESVPGDEVAPVAAVDEATTSNRLNGRALPATGRTRSAAAEADPVPGDPVPGDRPPVDAARSDAAETGAGPADAARSDAAETVAAETDAAPAAPVDAATSDAATSDAVQTGAARTRSSRTRKGRTNTAPTDAAVDDAAFTDSNPPAL